MRTTFQQIDATKVIETIKNATKLPFNLISNHIVNEEQTFDGSQTQTIVIGLTDQEITQSSRESYDAADNLATRNFHTVLNKWYNINPIYKQSNNWKLYKSLPLLSIYWLPLNQSNDRITNEELANGNVDPIAYCTVSMTDSSITITLIDTAR